MIIDTRKIREGMSMTDVIIDTVKIRERRGGGGTGGGSHIWACLIGISLQGPRPLYTVKKNTRVKIRRSSGNPCVIHIQLSQYNYVQLILYSVQYLKGAFLQGFF